MYRIVQWGAVNAMPPHCVVLNLTEYLLKQNPGIKTHFMFADFVKSLQSEILITHPFDDNCDVQEQLRKIHKCEVYEIIGIIDKAFAHLRQDECAYLSCLERLSVFYSRITTITKKCNLCGNILRYDDAISKYQTCECQGYAPCAIL